MSFKSKLLFDGIDDRGGTAKSKFDSKSSYDKLEKLDRYKRISFEGGQDIDKTESYVLDKTKSQKSDIADERLAGDEFLIWEPKGLKQKVRAFWNNSFEVIYVLCSALIALIYSSAIAAFFFILSTAMLLSQNQSIKVRYTYGLIVLIVQVIFDFIIIIFKMVYIKYIDQNDFKKSEKLYKSIGYTLIEGKSETFQVDRLNSFQMEFFLLAIIICAFIYLNTKRQNLNKLQNTKRRDILQLIALEAPVDEDDEVKRIGIGTKELDQDERINSSKIQEDIENNKKLLKELNKKIIKNFVESSYFYNLNQWFFMLSLLFQFIQMMSYNTLLDLPILIIVLVLVAFYDLRKNYTVLYRSYCFFVVYWMQTVMIIKLVHDILIRTYAIDSWLKEKDNCKTVLSKMNSILFGSEQCEKLTDIQIKDDKYEMFYYYTGIFISIFCCQCWKNTKWMEIREKTQNVSGVSSIQRFLIYVKARQQEDIDTKKFAEQIQEDKKKQQEEKSYKQKDDKKNKKAKNVQNGSRYDANKSYKKAKQDRSQYFPIIVMWLCRINLFILSYMYHSSVSFVNLIWIILSFLLSSQNTFFISSFVMVPLLTWEFLLIYGSRVPIIKGQPIFMIMDSYFKWDMQNQPLELVFMYFSLAIFYVQISCFMKSIQPQAQEVNLLEYFKKRIENQKYSIAWKYLFLCCPYIQTIFLLALFIKGSAQINTLVNLGYLIFFVVYTAYIQIYRKTGFILVIFVSFFILSQYYGQSMYMRLSPSYFDWMILILMSVLDQVNQMYKDHKKVLDLTEQARFGIKDSLGKISYYYQRVKNIITGLLIYLAMASMILIHQFIQTNFINWLFFILNLAVFSMMIFNRKNAKSLKNLLNISYFTKQFALVILILMILFILFIGSREKTDQYDSLDQKFKRNFQQIYNLLPLVGFRTLNLQDKNETFEEANENIRYKLISYVWFFMISLYLCSHFEQELKVSQENDNFEEQDYKKLFEYTMPKHEEQKDKEKQKDEEQKDKEEIDHPNAQVIIEKSKEEAKKPQIEEEKQQPKEEVENKSIYNKKDFYAPNDLYEFYEGTRFTLPFMVYRYVEYWGIFDFIAQNGHFLNYSIMVMNALYFSTSIYMGINIILICYYYLQSSRNLGKRAKLNHQISGLQSQCDIKMAQLITKRYKSEQFYEFLMLRKKIWKLQFLFYMLAVIIGYPTWMLHQLKANPNFQDDQDQYHMENRVQLKTVTFWFFISGIMKPENDTSYSYQRVFFTLLLGLIFDRITINWLTNRFGCNYFKLQKFIELDQRREAQRYKWETQNPEYDIERYRKWYYLNDFDDLKERFQSRSYQDMIKKRQLNDNDNNDKKKGLQKYQLSENEKKYQDHLFGDFIPAKVGLRILEFVQFSVQIDCQAPETNQDDETKQKLKYWCKCQDFEQIAIYKEFKSNQLRKILKQNVDLKYKISFSKGMMLLSEQLILMMLSISLVLKANIFSLIYLVFIVKFVYSQNKPKLLPRINNCMALCLSIQYILYVSNLTSQTSAVSFPTILKDDIFAIHQNGNSTIIDTIHAVPWFFHYEGFKYNMMLGYLIGIGVEETQIQNLLIDFFILYFISAYLLEYRNPIFLRQMKKVFWQYPTVHDSQKKWDRLTPEVKQQVNFFRNPKKLPELHIENLSKNEQKKLENQKNLEQEQFNFALDYKKYTKLDLNYLLTNYVDMKYTKVWSDEFLSEVKREMKQNSIYFRIVKQGSMLTYLTLHIFTIFVILLMATMRQSLLSLIYVFMLLPQLKHGSEVLNQTDAQIQSTIEKLDQEIQQNEKKLSQEDIMDQIKKDLKEKNVTIDEQVTQMLKKYLQSSNDEIQAFKKQMQKILLINDDIEYEQYVQSLLSKQLLKIDDQGPFIIAQVEKKRTLTSDEIQRLVEDIQINKQELVYLKKKLKKSLKAGSSKQSNQQKQWIIIKIIENYLCPLALIDFTLQVLFQLPTIYFTDEFVIQLFDWFGLRKVWKIPSEVFYRNFFQDSYVGKTGNKNLIMDQGNFANEIMNCIIINSVLLQKEIFISNGYKKFISSQNGTMSYLIQISELKAKSLAYIFNNHKIRKIISIQQRREQILATVEKVKQKIVRWREFTKTTLDPTIPKKIENEDQGLISKQISNYQSFTEIKSTVYQKSEIEKSYSNLDNQQFTLEKSAKINYHRLSKDEAEGIFDVLAYEFVEAKKKKLRLCLRLNQWLMKTFVQLIMLKNNKNELIRLNKLHAQCFVEIPTEFEKLMFEESKEQIKSFYENMDGLQELSVQCKKYSGPRTLIQKMKMPVKSFGALSLLDITGIEKKIKLKQLQRTWEFSRRFPLFMRNIEAFFYIILSQTQNFIYLGMILSMYQNAGIISIFYPLAVFGYALLEETRPSKQFWDLIRNYTNILLFVKFFLNLSLFESLLTDSNFVFVNAIVQIGIYDYQSILYLTMYMMPEILIISFIMLNEIKLKLLGLNEDTEQDIEPLQDAIQRNLMDGDEEKMYQNKIEKQNMCMQRCFIERSDQLYFMNMHQKELRSQIAFNAEKIDLTTLHQKLKIKIDEQDKDYSNIEKIRNNYVDEQYDEQYSVDEKQEQMQALSEISRLVWKTSRKFDLDSADKKNKFDLFIEENVIQKSLESDNLIYVEGFRPVQQNKFLSKHEFIEEKKLKNNWENISSGDFEGDFEGKINYLENRQKDSPSFFEKSVYFQRLFPSLKIQKPGADFYGASCVILALIIIYVLMCFKYYTVDSDVFKFVKGQSSIFKGELAYTIVFLIFIMMVERFASRTDTKKNENKDDFSQVYENKQKQQRFFSNSDMFYRQKTERSMTVKLQTVKTKNFDIEADSSQNFLKQQIQQMNDASQADDNSSTIITIQQKTKFYLHWFMLIAGHVYVFWYVPISGNFHLYGQPNCQNKDVSDYGCKDFHNNVFLRILYAMLVIYLWISSIQLSLGFPIMKKPSSILQYYNDISKAGADVYISIPFACEIRCLLDWTMSKTALDIFQFFQLYNHHYELYSAKVGNRWYGEKILGSKTPIQEKCIFSGIFSSIIIILLVGPFYLFSDNSPLVDVNPVLNGNVAVNFIVNKTLQDNVIDIEPYNIYDNQNLLLRTFTQKQWKNSTVSDSVVTRNFQPKQVQECHINEYSDSKWKISVPKRKELYKNFMDQNIGNSSLMNVSLQLDLKLKRALPDTTTEAYLKINRTLNYSLYHDCMTGMELQRLTQLDCNGTENPNYNTSIVIKQVYNPLMLLGITNAINEVYGEINYDMPMSLQKRNDIKLTYGCDGTWSIKGRTNYTEYTQEQLDKRIVYPNNCSLVDQSNKTLNQNIENERLSVGKNWEALKLILFSMIVSTSVLAAYSPQTFYTGIVVLAFYSLRPALIYSTWCSVVWECNNPDPIIKVVEACYLHRHEENLIGEEETYCLLREIFRSPEFIKALSGSSLKGSTSPQLDNLSKEQKKKLVHLDMLEQKGFEVTALKEKIYKSTQVEKSQM